MRVEGPEPGSFFALLSDSDRESLFQRGGLRRFARGARLMREGESGDRVLVLISGHVKASSTDARGQEMVFSFRGPGDVLGELSFTDAGPRSSDVTAIDPVTAQSYAASEFREFLLERPSAALTLIESIGRRLRDANRKRVQFGELDTLGRIADRLIELAERYGQATEDGVRIGLPVTQDDLGSWTASSRAGVANALRSMREQGWITTARRSITIVDHAALAHAVMTPTA